MARYTPSAHLATDSVLADLAADSWFQAQQDVATWYVPAPAPVVTAGPDLWDGDDAEIHEFLALHPAF